MSASEEEGEQVFEEEQADMDVLQRKPCARIGLPDLSFFFASCSPPPILPMAGYRALVSGPPACGKTSLLLHFAYNCARQDSSSFVTFLCKPHSLDDNSPYLSQGVDLESEAFARITVKYVHDDEELRKYFAAFHLQRRFPRAVIIDGIFDLFNERSCVERFGQIRPRESAMVKTLALCFDAISFANENGGREAQCHLLISDSCVGEAPRLRFIYQRWLLQILMIEALDDATFCFSIGDDGSLVSKLTLAKYSILQGQLQLV